MLAVMRETCNAKIQRLLSETCSKVTITGSCAKEFHVARLAQSGAGDKATMNCFVVSFPLCRMQLKRAGG